MAASVQWRGMAVFSNSGVRHTSETGDSSVMRQRARIGNRSIRVSKLTQAPIGKQIMQVDAQRRCDFWPVCVTGPGSGLTDSEEPSDDIQYTEVPDSLNSKLGGTGTGSTDFSQSANPPATIDQSAESLPRSFLAESVDGNLVECSGRGCRPLYNNVLAEHYQLRNTYTGSCLTEVDKSAMKNAFHAALEITPDNARLVWEYAVFTWISLGDIDAAEELYNKALELAPHDTNIQASHARFLLSLAT